MRIKTENNSAANKKNSHSTASHRNKKNGRTSAPAPLGTHADTAGMGDEQVRKLQAAEARAAAEQHTAASLLSDVRTGSVGHPNNIGSVKMEELQQHLRFDDVQWNALQTCVRDTLSAAHLDLNAKWKAQAPRKLSMAYNVKRSSHNSAASPVNGLLIALPSSAGANSGPTGAVLGTRQHTMVVAQLPVMLLVGRNDGDEDSEDSDPKGK
ncbi:hypothetical protein B0H14DRAFT_2585978 [Mycena olivaceomarginata]|nr:hypothetical protein B0H14DRAFT_2585978 [Mycena olivaceomarginata]